MTEVDIMNDLECCRNNNCNDCSRFSTIGACTNDLIRDAKSVIRLQKDSLENAKESIERLTAERNRFEEMSRFSLDLDEFVNVINAIIREAYLHGNGWGGSDDYGDPITHGANDNWAELISAIRGFLKKADRDSEYVMVLDEFENDYPQLRKR